MKTNASRWTGGLIFLLWMLGGGLACLPSSSVVVAQENPAQISDAKSLYWAGKYDEVIKLCKSVLEKEPSSVPAYTGLVLSLLKQDAVAEAELASQKVIEVAPQSPMAHDLLAEVFFRKGEIAEAEVEYKKALDLGGATARAWRGLGRIARAGSMFKTAAMLFESAHQFDPNDPDIYNDRVGSLTTRAEQIAALQTVLRDSPNLEAERQHSIERQIERLKQLGDQSYFELASPVEKTEIDLENIYYSAKSIRGVGLPVSVNGSKPVVLLLDTGASGITLNAKTAERVGVKRFADVKLQGIGDKGPVGAYVGLVQSVRVGKLEFGNCWVSVIEKKNDAVEDGLIGADVFSKFLVTIDIHRLRFRLDLLPKRAGEPDPKGRFDRTWAPEMRSFRPVYRSGTHLLIPTIVNKSRPLLFLLDTGAFDTQLANTAALEFAHADKEGSYKLGGISGEVKQKYLVGSVMLEFGSFRQPAINMWAIDLSPISKSAGIEHSGILGYRMLKELVVMIDYRDGLVKFERSE